MSFRRRCPLTILVKGFQISLGNMDWSAMWIPVRSYSHMYIWNKESEQFT